MAQNVTPLPYQRSQGSRRQLTVLFCDLVNSTELSESLGIEDWCELLQLYHAYCAEIITQFNGHIAQYLGDGLLVYFGYPQSFENNAHSAANAALTIVRELGRLHQQAKSLLGDRDGAIRVRLAIHSGPVVINAMDATAQHTLALGIVPAVASRLQEIARPNSVVISQDTYILLRGAFVCEPLGEQKLKGVKEPLDAFELINASGLNTRFEIALTQGLAPIVGRDDELRFLDRIWGEVTDSQGHIVMVTGDPGIGKSRLIQEFLDRINSKENTNEQPFTVVTRCSTYHTGSALFSVNNIAQSLFRISAEKSESENIVGIRQLVESVSDNPGTATTLIAQFLGIGQQQKSTLNLSATREKDIVFETLIHCLLKKSAQQPIQLLVEDYHWIDPSSVEFLQQLTQQIADHKILLIVTYRPEAKPPWQRNSYTDQITLGPLHKKSAEQLVNNLQGNRQLPASWLQRLVEDTDGVPLFLEESVLMLLGDDQQDLQNELQLDIPATLQDLLMARLDRLGPAKSLAQLAAAIGREFSYELLSNIAPLDTPTLQQQINLLIDTGLVYPLNTAADSITGLYSFKHALVCDTAYHSILSRQAKEIHLHIASTLEKIEVSSDQKSPEIIAHHFTRGDDFNKAVHYWKQAGMRSTRQHAYTEAITHFQTALDLLENLPGSEKRDQDEMELCTLLAGRLIATKGYGVIEVETLYLRAEKVAKQLGVIKQQLQVTLGLEAVYFYRSDFSTAIKLAERCLDLAKKLNDPLTEIKTHWSFGEIYFHLGEYKEGELHLRYCIDNYKIEYHKPRNLQNPAVMSYSYLSWLQWLKGDTAEAMHTVNEAINLAELLNHPFSRAVAYSFMSGLNLFCENYSDAKDYADRAVAICDEQGFTAWLAFAQVVRGRARVALHEWVGGIQEIRAGIELWSKSGALVTKPYCHAMLTEALMISHAYDDAQIEIDTALSIAEKNGEGYYLPELYRLQGEILSKIDSPNVEENSHKAQSCFDKAFMLAKKQQSESLLQRIITSQKICTRR